jgi:hypothetical protein
MFYFSPRTALNREGLGILVDAAAKTEAMHAFAIHALAAQMKDSSNEH